MAWRTRRAIADTSGPPTPMVSNCVSIAARLSAELLRAWDVTSSVARGTSWNAPSMAVIANFGWDGSDESLPVAMAISRRLTGPNERDRTRGADLRAES